jgi:hypothetical protein
MGTTCVAVYFLDDSLIIGHVGDSRCYRARGTELQQLTEDHSLINDYIRMKRVTPEEAENWPHKNVIVRALGMKESVQVDILTETPRVGDTYLLCSDGLTGMVKDDQIQHVLMSERDVDRAVERMITAANEEGGIDNISVVLARVEVALRGWSSSRSRSAAASRVQKQEAGPTAAYRGLSAQIEAGEPTAAREPAPPTRREDLQVHDPRRCEAERSSRRLPDTRSRPGSRSRRTPSRRARRVQTRA